MGSWVRFLHVKRRSEKVLTQHRTSQRVTEGWVLGEDRSWGTKPASQASGTALPHHPVLLPLGLPGLPSLVGDDPVLPGSGDAPGREPGPGHQGARELAGGEAEDAEAAAAALCEWQARSLPCRSWALAFRKHSSPDTQAHTLGGRCLLISL